VDKVLLIAGANNPAIADYAAFASRVEGRRLSVVTTSDICGGINKTVDMHPIEHFDSSEYLETHSCDSLAGVVVFLNRKLTACNRKLLETVSEIARKKSAECVCLISSLRVHFGDRRATQTEEWAVKCLRGLPGRVVVFRPAPINSPCSVLSARIGMLRFLSQVVPERFKGCCVEGDELFAAVEGELKSTNFRRHRVFTLLGPNRPWTHLLAKKSEGRPLSVVVRVTTLLLRLLLGQVAGLLFGLVVKLFPEMRMWSFDTLRPTTVRDLLVLYNKYNYRHVKIVGYNNGVTHFGQRHPGKTILSTAGCNHGVRLWDDLARFDGGVTVREAMSLLATNNKELHVVPNYSYVSIGTSYFIPIHGSASKYCTLAETIEKVCLYDPIDDQFFVASRQDPTFARYMYNLSTDVLLLQLTLKIRDKTRYFRIMRTMANPSSQQILALFKDHRAANIELRKAGVASTEVRVYQYYMSPPDGDSVPLELPRDRLGSLWDRLESNPITSALFHGLTRRFAHHVELFLPEDDFAMFWKTHDALPLSKIQVRYIRRDGFPNSPFREQDCVSVDLFMLKKHKRAFESYVKQTFRAARMNPGKHSM
jgi:hypothetical protein